MLDFESLQKQLGFYTWGVSKTPFQGFEYAISLVFKLSDYVVENITEGPTYEYFHHYRTINAAIDRAVYQIGVEIEREGYTYLPIAASQTVGGHASMRAQAGGSAGRAGRYRQKRAVYRKRNRSESTLRHNFYKHAL